MKRLMIVPVVLAAALGLLKCSGGPACGADPEGVQQQFATPTAEDKQLSERVVLKAAEVQGTPAKEAANRLNIPAVAEFVRMLKGDLKATKAQLDRARQDIQELDKTLDKGPRWPMPPMCLAPRAAEPPEIDGKLDDPAWSKAATYEGCFAFGDDKKREAPRTVWRVTWDEQYLYFAFECADADIIAPKVKRDDHVYFNDCVEMFILPEFRTGSYWEIVISPTLSIFDGLHSKPADQWGPVSRPEENVQGIRFASRINGTPDKSDDEDVGYTVEVAVPFAQLPEYSRARPMAGQTLRFMLVRLDKNKGGFTPYAYQPLLSWGHNIWNHATMKLVE